MKLDAIKAKAFLRMVESMRKSTALHKVAVKLHQSPGRNYIEPMCSELRLTRKQVIAAVARLRNLGIGVRSDSSAEFGLWYELTMEPEHCTKGTNQSQKGMSGMHFVERSLPPVPQSVWPWLTGSVGAGLFS